MAKNVNPSSQPIYRQHCKIVRAVANRDQLFAIYDTCRIFVNPKCLRFVLGP